MQWTEFSLAVANVAGASARVVGRSPKTFSRTVQSAVDPHRSLAYSPAHTRRRHDREQTKLRHGRRTSLPFATSHESLLTHVRGCRRQRLQEAVHHTNQLSEPRGWVVDEEDISFVNDHRSGQRSTEASAVADDTLPSKSGPTHPDDDRTRRASVIASNRSRKGFASFAPLGRVLFRELFLCAQGIEPRRHDEHDVRKRELATSRGQASPLPLSSLCPSCRRGEIFRVVASQAWRYNPPLD
jgi:hypothetical protein